MSEVYFIRPVGQKGPVKIGCTTLLRDRLAGLNMWSPLLLEVAAITPGAYDLERRFHALFLASRDRGEWFHWSQELEDVIAGVAAGTFDFASLPEPKFLPQPRGTRRLKQEKGPRAPRAPRRIEQSIHDASLTTDVVAFCNEWRVARTAFGRAAVSDPNFVDDLLAGRRPRASVCKRARSYIAAHRQASRA